MTINQADGESGEWIMVCFKCVTTFSTGFIIQ